MYQGPCSLITRVEDSRAELQLFLTEIYTEEGSEDSMGTMTFLALQLGQCHWVLFLWIAYVNEYSPSVLKQERGREEKTLLLSFI